MLRISADDPLACSLFTSAELAGVRKLQRRKKGKRAGDLTEEQQIELQLEHRGLIGFSRQYQFAIEIGRRWAFDFAWVRHKLAVEYEGLVMRKVGGQWQTGGRHATITGLREDCVKYNAAARLGWTVLRYEREMVRQGQLYDDVSKFLTQCGVTICRPPTVQSTAQPDL